MHLCFFNTPCAVGCLHFVEAFKLRAIPNCREQLVGLIMQLNATVSVSKLNEISRLMFESYLLSDIKCIRRLNLQSQLLQVRFCIMLSIHSKHAGLTKLLDDFYGFKFITAHTVKRGNFRGNNKLSVSRTILRQETSALFLGESNLPRE